MSTTPKTVSDVDTASILEKKKSDESREICSLEMAVFSINFSAYCVFSGY